MYYIKDNFITGLKNTNWEDFWTINNPGEAWEYFVSKIGYLLDLTCPIKTFNCKQKKQPWIDNKLLQVIIDKNEAMSKFKRTHDEDDQRISDFQKNRCKHLCRKAKKEYHLQEIAANKNKPKAYWASINKLINPKISDPHFSLVDQNTGIDIASEDTANYINTYFATIGDKLAEKMNAPWIPTQPVIDSNFDFRPATIEELLPLLKKINVNKTSGVENVSTKVLKDALLALPLHFLFIVNLVLATSVFPDQWKIALVSPLRKGGDSSDVNNLRPISVLPLPAKLTEKIIHKQTLDYLNNNDLLSENQDGFRPARSTIDSLEKFTNKVYSNLNLNQCTTATFLDFKKAFDTLNHNILLKKLKNLGFNPLIQ